MDFSRGTVAKDEGNRRLRDGLFRRPTQQRRLIAVVVAALSVSVALLLCALAPGGMTKTKTPALSSSFVAVVEAAEFEDDLGPRGEEAAERGPPVWSGGQDEVVDNGAEEEDGAGENGRVPWTRRWWSRTPFGRKARNGPKEIDEQPASSSRKSWVPNWLKRKPSWLSRRKTVEEASSEGTGCGVEPLGEGDIVKVPLATITTGVSLREMEQRLPQDAEPDAREDAPLTGDMSVEDGNPNGRSLRLPSPSWINRNVAKGVTEYRKQKSFFSFLRRARRKSSKQCKTSRDIREELETQASPDSLTSGLGTQAMGVSNIIKGVLRTAVTYGTRGKRSNAVACGIARVVHRRRRRSCLFSDLLWSSFFESLGMCPGDKWYYCSLLRQVGDIINNESLHLV